MFYDLKEIDLKCFNFLTLLPKWESTWNWIWFALLLISFLRYPRLFLVQNVLVMNLWHKSSLNTNIVLVKQFQRTTTCNCGSPTRAKSVCCRTVGWWSSCFWTPRVWREVGCASSDWEWVSKQCCSYFCWTFFRSTSKMIRVTAEDKFLLHTWLAGQF